MTEPEGMWSDTDVIMATVICILATQMQPNQLKVASGEMETLAEKYEGAAHTFVLTCAMTLLAYADDLELENPCLTSPSSHSSSLSMKPPPMNPMT